MDLTFDNPSNRFLVLMLLADAVFIGLHIVHIYTDLLPNPLFSITRGRGYGEIFQYLKEFWVSALFLLWAIKRASLLYLSWAGFFLYLLLENSLKIHKQMGGAIAHYLGFHAHFGFRAHDLGDFSGAMFFGIFFLGVIGVPHYLSDREGRKISFRLFAMAALLAFFGVVIDMADNIVRSQVLELIEDGGEMLIMSVITGFVFRLRPKRAQQHAFEEHI